MRQVLWKAIRKSLKWLNGLSEAAILPLGINPRELKPYIHIKKKKPCTHTSIAAGFTIAKSGNNPSVH